MRAGGERAEEAFRRGADRLVLDLAGGGEHHPLGRVFARHEGADGVAVEAPDGLRPAEDRAPDRLACEGRLHEGVEDEVVRRVLDGGVFLQDDALLARELGLVEARFGEDVAEHVEGDVDVLAEHPRGVVRELDARSRR